MYKYVKATLEENKEFFDSYVHSLSGIYDDFLEHHILNSEIYSIYKNVLAARLAVFFFPIIKLPAFIIDKQYVT